MEFDFVIVGAGSAGCVLANRLSANGKYQVAVLEAGDKDSYPWIHVPVGYFKTMGNPRTDWCYETQGDKGLAGRAIKWPRGKVWAAPARLTAYLRPRSAVRLQLLAAVRQHGLGLGRRFTVVQTS